jgi:LacI family transcriptional regulator
MGDVRRMTSVTIYDVAGRAGVSIKTVSRVMNKEPGVKPATRERVAQAAEAMGYRPSLSARSLAGSRSFVIAAFVDAALTIDHWRSGLAGDYLARVQLGATVECRRAGYHFMVELIDRDPDGVSRQVRDVLGALKPDGVLLTPPSCDDATVLALLAAARVPFVRLGAEAAGGGGLRLRMDDEGAAAAVTERLIGLGHRRIGLVQGKPDYAASQARLQGYRQAMAAHGLDTPGTLIRPGDFTFQSGCDGAAALLALADRPTAIFACNDDMALGCLAAVGDAGLSVPRDVSVAGFDGSVGARFCNPALTTVGHPLDALAELGVRALISGEADPDTDRDLASPFPFTLLERGSTGPAPSGGGAGERA